MRIPLNCFKRYDVRALLGPSFNAEIAACIGRAFAHFLAAKTIVVGCDRRTSNKTLKHAVIKGLLQDGIEVLDIGVSGSEEMYFAVCHFAADGGIEITASHNSPEYGGMKFVRQGARPISENCGLVEIRSIAEKPLPTQPNTAGRLVQQNITQPYVEHLISHLTLPTKKTRIAVDTTNGTADHVMEALIQEFGLRNIPLEIFFADRRRSDLDTLTPDPQLTENRNLMEKTVNLYQTDFGITFDGDFDRCVFYDETGRLIDSYYILGLLAAYYIEGQPGNKIIYEPRLVWNTVEIVEQGRGEALVCQPGHSIIKQKMREENAVYGGEMSGHHYFRDFFYCDSGMIPWLIVLNILTKKGATLSSLLRERMERFPCSGEINFALDSPPAEILRQVEKHFRSGTQSETGKTDFPRFDDTDGLSVEFQEWRFNLRGSNTENLLRLNIETRANRTLLQDKKEELSRLIHSL